MTFEEYQKKSRETAIYPNKDSNFIYPTLGLSGEAGEVAEKVKKILRDKKGKVDDGTRTELEKELGDVLWYVAQLATEFGLTLENVAAHNIEKLFSRKDRGALHGDGTVTLCKLVSKR
jgi:NTP pyrophosphatase (non-canonical NTP hydrolase)